MQRSGELVTVITIHKIMLMPHPPERPTPVCSPGKQCSSTDSCTGAVRVRNYNAWGFASSFWQHLYFRMPLPTETLGNAELLIDSPVGQARWDYDGRCRTAQPCGCHRTLYNQEPLATAGGRKAPVLFTCLCVFIPTVLPQDLTF